jgi:hypothetical protein
MRSRFRRWIWLSDWEKSADLWFNTGIDPAQSMEIYEVMLQRELESLAIRLPSSSGRNLRPVPKIVNDSLELWVIPEEWTGEDPLA